jgi:hypothetical protein
MKNNRCFRIAFRLLASGPPIILGMIFRDLGAITDYTGTAGFVLIFSIPAMLYLKSKQLAIEKHFSGNTYYTSYGSSKPIADLLFWFGILLLVCVVASLIFI